MAHYYRLKDPGDYTLARDIESDAIDLGYTPLLDKRGGTHPGRVCNLALGRIERASKRLGG